MFLPTIKIVGFHNAKYMKSKSNLIFLSGNYTDIKQYLNSNYNNIKYVDDIIKYLSNSNISLFNISNSTKYVYFLYENKYFKDKESIDYFLELVKNKDELIIIGIIETDIDKRSAFYHAFKGKIKEVGKSKNDVPLIKEYQNYFYSGKFNKLYNIPANNIVSFLYALYFDYKHRKYKKTIGFIINQILQGKLKNENVLQYLILLAI